MKTECKVSSGQLCCCIHPANHYEPTIVAGILGDSERSRSRHVSVGICALHCAAVLCLVISPCGPVQRIHAGEGIDVPYSRSWPPATVPFSPTLVCLQLPSSESKWSRVGADKGAEEDRRSRHPFPRALPGISAVLLPRVCQWEPSRWMGSFVFRQWGWICLSESKWAGGPPPSRRRHEWEPNTTCPWWTWMSSVPAERRLTSFSGSKRLLGMSAACFRAFLHKWIYSGIKIIHRGKLLCLDDFIRNFQFHFRANSDIPVGKVRQEDTDKFKVIIIWDYNVTVTSI